MTDQNISICPSSEVLAAYLAGSLTGDEHSSVTDHLGTCPACYKIFVDVARDEASERKQSRIRFYGAAAGLAAAIVVAFLGIRLMLNRSLPVVVPPDRGTIAYWIEKYGVVPQEDALAASARLIFDRLLRVTEHSPQTEPKLLIVREAGMPYALSLRDGTIVLSADTVNLCYQDVSPDHGSARLAFVLAHEFVHQKHQQLPHAAAFAAVEQDLQSPRSRVSAPHLREARLLEREKELEADAYGLVYATMAGYDPRTVLKQEPDFIRAWVSQIPLELAYTDDAHPGPEERAEYLRTYLQDVANDLDYFHFGVRLYQLGRYEDAIVLLTRFAEKFPAREVWNNLGLSHYQLAMQALSGCDSKYVEQFYPATILDTQTLAGQLRSTSPGSCLERKAFRDEMDQADRSFRRAIEMDPAYVPAKVNLSSVLIVRQEYTSAGEVLKEALQQQPEDPAARNNQAVTGYLSDPSQIESSLAALQTILATIPNFAPALYNKAILDAKSGTTDVATQSQKRFLEHESHGLYAAAVRDALGIRAPMVAASYPAMTSPIPLGDRNRRANELLAKMKEIPFTLDDLEGAFFQEDSYRVLVLDDMIEVVESTPTSTVDPSFLKSRYGTPVQILSTPAGSVERYSNFALDIQDGRVAAILHFEE